MKNFFSLRRTDSRSGAPPAKPEVNKLWSSSPADPDRSKPKQPRTLSAQKLPSNTAPPSANAYPQQQYQQQPSYATNSQKLPPAPLGASTSRAAASVPGPSNIAASHTAPSAPQTYSHATTRPTPKTHDMYDTLGRSTRTAPAPNNPYAYYPRPDGTSYQPPPQSSQPSRPPIYAPEMWIPPGKANSQYKEAEQREIRREKERPPDDAADRAQRKAEKERERQERYRRHEEDNYRPKQRETDALRDRPPDRYYRSDPEGKPPDPEKEARRRDREERRRERERRKEKEAEATLRDLERAKERERARDRETDVLALQRVKEAEALALQRNAERAREAEAIQRREAEALAAQRNAERAREAEAIQRREAEALALQRTAERAREAEILQYEKDRAKTRERGLEAERQEKERQREERHREREKEKENIKAREVERQQKRQQREREHLEKRREKQNALQREQEKLLQPMAQETSYSYPAGKASTVRKDETDGTRLRSAPQAFSVQRHEVDPYAIMGPKSHVNAKQSTDNSYQRSYGSMRATASNSTYLGLQPTTVDSTSQHVSNTKDQTRHKRMSSLPVESTQGGHSDSDPERARRKERSTPRERVIMETRTAARAPEKIIPAAVPLQRSQAGDDSPPLMIPPFLSNRFKQASANGDASSRSANIVDSHTNTTLQNQSQSGHGISLVSLRAGQGPADPETPDLFCKPVQVNMSSSANTMYASTPYYQAPAFKAYEERKRADEIAANQIQAPYNAYQRHSGLQDGTRRSPAQDFRAGESGFLDSSSSNLAQGKTLLDVQPVADGSPSKHSASTITPTQTSTQQLAKHSPSGQSYLAHRSDIPSQSANHLPTAFSEANKAEQPLPAVRSVFKENLGPSTIGQSVMSQTMPATASANVSTYGNSHRIHQPRKLEKAPPVARTTSNQRTASVSAPAVAQGYPEPGSLEETEGRTLQKPSPSGRTYLTQSQAAAAPIQQEEQLGNRAQASYDAYHGRKPEKISPPYGQANLSNAGQPTMLSGTSSQAYFQAQPSGNTELSPSGYYPEAFNHNDRSLTNPPPNQAPQYDSRSPVEALADILSDSSTPIPPKTTPRTPSSRDANQAAIAGGFRGEHDREQKAFTTHYKIEKPHHIASQYEPRSSPPKVSQAPLASYGNPPVPRVDDATSRQDMRTQDRNGGYITHHVNSQPISQSNAPAGRFAADTSMQNASYTASSAYATQGSLPSVAPPISHQQSSSSTRNQESSRQTSSTLQYASQTTGPTPASDPSTLRRSNEPRVHEATYASQNYPLPQAQSYSSTKTSDPSIPPFSANNGSPNATKADSQPKLSTASTKYSPPLDTNSNRIAPTLHHNSPRQTPAVQQTAALSTHPNLSQTFQAQTHQQLPIEPTAAQPYRVNLTSTPKVGIPYHNPSSQMSSRESLLRTPSSLAPSIAPTLLLKPTISRASAESRSDRKKGGLFSMFKPKSVHDHEVRDPPGMSKHSDNDILQYESSPKLSDPSGSKSSLASRARVPAPVKVPIPIQSSGRQNTQHKVFTPFRFLTSRRQRTMSSASVDAQDGTAAANTTLGSPTVSMSSQNPPLQPPPLRDPQIATEQWRDREEAAHRERRGKLRRTRPGVVFDITDDPSMDRTSTRVMYKPKSSKQYDRGSDSERERERERERPREEQGGPSSGSTDDQHY